MAQAKSMLRGHNDLVMSSKLREVEIEKVKEFAALVQSDLEQADADQTAMEIVLQEERQKRVELEKGRGGKKGEAPSKSSKDEVANVRKEGKLEVATVQRQADASQRELGLQQDIYARQRSVYEAGLREMMRIMQLRAARPDSGKVEDLIAENDKLRSEVTELRARAR
jgi:hypothetical protein